MPIELISRPCARDDLPRVVGLLVSRLAAGHHFDITVANLRQVLPDPRPLVSDTVLILVHHLPLPWGVLVVLTLRSPAG